MCQVIVVAIWTDLRELVGNSSSGVSQLWLEVLVFFNEIQRLGDDQTPLAAERGLLLLFPSTKDSTMTLVKSLHPDK